MSLAAVTLVLLAAALPGMALARRRGAALAFGACLSLGAHATVLGFVPALGGGWLVAIDLVAALAAFFGTGAGAGTGAGRGTGLRRRARRRALEVATVLSVFASFAVLAERHGAPRGWDPSFHVLLVEKLARGERPATWEPWEPVSVHYTLGADALVAHAVRATGLGPHQAFEAAFPAAYALLAWSALGAFRRAARSRTAGVFGALALALLGGEVRLVYHWGGLPTVLGMAFALGAAQARSSIGAGLLLGSLAHLHHLSALVAWSACGVLALALRSRAIARALGTAVLVALPLAPQVLAATSGAGTTSIFRFGDEPLRPLADYVWSPTQHVGLGVGLIVLGALGAARPPRGALAVFGFLLGVHVFLDVGYRLAMRRLTGEDVTALTPSRWLQLSSLPLALLAGQGARRIFPRRRHALLGAVSIAVAAVPFLRWEYRGRYDARGLDPQLFELAEWARSQLPEDAFVVVRAGRPPLLPDRYWWPYLLDRETDETPLPASEPRRDPRVLAKRALAADPRAARAYAASRKKKLFWLRPVWFDPVEGCRTKGDWNGIVALDEDD